MNWLQGYWGHLEMEGEEEEGSSSNSRGVLKEEENQWSKFDGGDGGSYEISEIEEEDPNDMFEIDPSRFQLDPIREEFEVDEESLFSLGGNYTLGGGDDRVYVGVGKGKSSLHAVFWSVKLALKRPSTAICLVHVFPELKYIPSPLGKLPKSRANPEVVQFYTEIETTKRRQFLQKFASICSAWKVNVETVLIESDNVAKALVDLIPVLNIRKLIIGTSKSKIRKLKSRRGNGIANQVLEEAPEFCDVNIICEGKQLLEEDTATISSTTATPRTSVDTIPSRASICSSSSGSNMSTPDNNPNSMFACFLPKFI
ncbi:hypothetical protein RJ641_002504 [Dillenia turbinata]|uniref:UspA domain-containing protein n=1 Tax=Dillenia turbinata TaxID=194707 RepID=A0AAN8ZFP6_9MAGN